MKKFYRKTSVCIKNLHLCWYKRSVELNNDSVISSVPFNLRSSRFPSLGNNISRCGFQCVVHPGWKTVKIFIHDFLFQCILMHFHLCDMENSLNRIEVSASWRDSKFSWIHVIPSRSFFSSIFWWIRALEKNLCFWDCASLKHYAFSSHALIPHSLPRSITVIKRAALPTVFKQA